MAATFFEEFPYLRETALRGDMDSLFRQIQENLLRKRREAGEAFQELQTQASAPPPEPSPYETGVSQLFGDVGSIIAGRPEFAARAREDVTQRRAMLLHQREQNLQILRDKYVAAARSAENIDPELSLKYNEKVEQLSKQLDDIARRGQIQLEGSLAMQRVEKQGETDRDVATIRGEYDLAIANLRMLTGGSAGMKIASPQAFDKAVTDIMGLYKKSGSLPSDSKVRFSLASQVSALQPWEGATERAYTAKLAQHMMGLGFKRKMHGVFVPDPTGQAIIRSALGLHFPKEKPETTGTTQTEAPQVGGVDVQAPIQQEIIVESPTGTLTPRQQLYVQELKDLSTKVYAPLSQRFLGMPTKQSVSDQTWGEIVQKRQRKRIADIIKTLAAQGIRVTMPAIPVEGTQNEEEITDEILNMPALPPEE